jgi:hypothetical protein
VPLQFPPFIAVTADVRNLLDAAAIAAAADPAGIFLADFNHRTISARLVRWLLLEVAPSLGGRVSRVQIEQATIDERIDLIGAALKVTMCFGGCTLAGIDLTDASAIAVEVIGGSVGFVRADRVKMTGSLLMRGLREDPTYRRRPPSATGAVTIAHGILLSGATIHGNLDLRGSRVGPLDGLPTGDVVAMLADGLEVAGNALLGDGFNATGEIRLNGSHIHRNLDCTSAQLHNPGGFTISAAGARVDGSVYICAEAGVAMISVGSLRLEGAEIGGDLDASGGNFIATAFHRPGWRRIYYGPLDNGDALDAILAAGMKVGGTVRCDRFLARGVVNFTSAQIGGDLMFVRARFNFPGEEALFCDSATILGAVYLDRVRTDGLLRFVQADVRQGCYCDSLKLQVAGERRGWAIEQSPVKQELGADICGLYAAGAKLGGSFIWRRVKRWPQADVTSRVVWLSAPGATIVDLADDEPSWKAVQRIDLFGCSYERIGTYDRPSNLTEQVDWRLGVLDREYARWNQRYKACCLRWQVLCRTWHGEHLDISEGRLGEQVVRFVPGPYLQLAQAMQRSGFAGAAEDVLLRLERNRTNYGGENLLGLARRWTISIALRYGQKPFRPAWILIAWVFISGPAFKWVHDASKSMQWPGAMKAVDVPDGVHFNWLFYTLDTLVPFVDFGQKKHFLVDPMASLGGALLLFNALLGYAALGFLAAGLSGLVRTGGDD